MREQGPNNVREQGPNNVREQAPNNVREQAPNNVREQGPKFKIKLHQGEGFNTAFFLLDDSYYLF